MHSIPCIVQCHIGVSGFFVPIFSTDTFADRTTCWHGLIRLYVKSASVVSIRKVMPSRIPARALTHGKAAIHKQALPAEPRDRSICFHRAAALQVPSLNLQ